MGLGVESLDGAHEVRRLGGVVLLAGDLDEAAVGIAGAVLAEGRHAEADVDHQVGLAGHVLQHLLGGGDPRALVLGEGVATDAAGGKSVRVLVDLRVGGVRLGAEQPVQVAAGVAGGLVHVLVCEDGPGAGAGGDGLVLVEVARNGIDGVVVPVVAAGHRAGVEVLVPDDVVHRARVVEQDQHVGRDRRREEHHVVHQRCRVTRDQKTEGDAQGENGSGDAVSGSHGVLLEYPSRLYADRFPYPAHQASHMPRAAPVGKPRRISNTDFSGIWFQA